jgi:hypothetical protein
MERTAGLTTQDSVHDQAATRAVKVIVGVGGWVVVMELQNGDDGPEIEDVLLVVDQLGHP